jgi:predicted nucleic acid-binding protein
MKYLLDTNVISELVAKQPQSKVIDWLDNTDESLIYLSVITLGEIKKGIERLPDSSRKTELRTWLTDELSIRFQGRILTIGTDVMLTWGNLTAALEQKGRKLPAMDSLVAAIALHGQLTLVTRNEGDFADTGVTILNLWK